MMHTFTSKSRTNLKLPWAPLKMYQRKIRIYAIRIDGPFEIVDDYGETTQYCIDGYLMYYDESNTPGLMSRRNFEKLYEEVI